jgi:hypothetical protein
MFAQLVCFEIHLRLEHDKLLLLAFPVQAGEVILPEVPF